MDKSTPEGRLYADIMTDGESEELVAALKEDAEELELAKDYRSLSATEFFKKYGDRLFFRVGITINGFDHEFLRKIDAGIETLDWIR